MLLLDILINSIQALVILFLWICIILVVVGTIKAARGKPKNFQDGNWVTLEEYKKLLKENGPEGPSTIAVYSKTPTGRLRKDELGVFKVDTWRADTSDDVQKMNDPEFGICTKPFDQEKQ